jgi:hypothetical protein
MSGPERRAYIQQLRGEADQDALQASLHENLGSVKELVDDLRRDGVAMWTTIRGGRDEQLWIYNALAELYRLRVPGVLTDEMTRLVREVGHLANEGSGFDVDAARAYIAVVPWTFAQTMWRWPHEYTVRGWNPQLVPAFEAFARFIRETGAPKPWPRDAKNPRYWHPYVEIDGRDYWTMGEPITESEVINRTIPEDLQPGRGDLG